MQEVQMTGWLSASSSLRGSLPLLALAWLQHSAGGRGFCGLSSESWQSSSQSQTCAM